MDGKASRRLDGGGGGGGPHRRSWFFAASSSRSLPTPRLVDGILQIEDLKKA